MIDIIKETLRHLKTNGIISKSSFRQAQALYFSGQVQLLTQATKAYEFTIDDEFDNFDTKIFFEEGKPHHKCSCKSEEVCHHAVASLIQLVEILGQAEEKGKSPQGKKYTKAGMVKRVLAERRERADKAEYTIEYNTNKFGEHTLINEKAVRYKITFRDLKKGEGYCTCPDFQTNKLGTCKHLMYAVDVSKSKRRMKSKQQYPFIEVFLDPKKNYQIAWYYPHKMSKAVDLLIKKHFGEKNHLPEKKVTSFLGFINEADAYKQILIRPEVLQKVEQTFETETLKKVKGQYNLNFSVINANLFPYQKEGIEFAAFREGAIIADDMGLGKTIQAIGVAIMKKQLFDFKRTLVICPASLKEQWQKEIEKFSDESGLVVQGKPEERAEQYLNKDHFFTIVNYEAVLRDSEVINKANFDLVILDEAQRIKNYNTKTSSAIKSVRKKHSLVITGTPIENRLIDVYSVVGFVDPKLLAPLWEFSYQHCYFDESKKNKITGYYNLQNLKKRLQSILIRREKRQVIKQLPKIVQLEVPINMHPKQAEYHAGYARGIASIISKKFMTPYDMQKLMLLLSKMRMVCNSTFLVDGQTHHSPKIDELKRILIDKIDLPNQDKKIIIFSEWIKMQNIIGKMLRENNIGYAELSGKVPVKKRGKLIEAFKNNPDCKVFLSTEAGGTGLNLQFADTVINFELPWNPAKKNQRIGRIDRIGQRHDNLTVINFICRHSIEERIANGLIMKQNLFEGVLNNASTTDVLDLSSKGRSQFFDEIEATVNEMIAINEEIQAMEEEFMSDIREDMQGYAEAGDTSDTPPAAPPAATDEPGTSTSPPKTAEGGEEGTSEASEGESKATNKETGEGEGKKAQPADATAETKSTNKQAVDGEGKQGTDTSNEPPVTQQMEQVEQVMNQGMGFLAGLFKMATGKDMAAGEQSISVDKETGEVTMKFKLPV